MHSLTDPQEDLFLFCRDQRHDPSITTIGYQDMIYVNQNKSRLMDLLITQLEIEFKANLPDLTHFYKPAGITKLNPL